MKKTTLVLGASLKNDRYSNKAIKSLVVHGHDVIAIGKDIGYIQNIEIQEDINNIKSPIDTISLYLNPQNQKQYYISILKLNPKRIIFNPGTENTELEELANNQGIITQQDCTLVLLSINKY